MFPKDDIFPKIRKITKILSEVKRKRIDYIKFYSF